VYDPTGHWWLSTLIAALPIIVLLGLLAGFKVRAHLCAIAGAAASLIIAILAFKMPAALALSSFFTAPLSACSRLSGSSLRRCFSTTFQLLPANSKS